MNQLLIGWIFLALVISVTIWGQLFYKSYSLGKKKSHFVFAIILFCCAVPFTFFSVRCLGLGRVYIGSSLSYVLTPIAAEFLLKEKVESTHWKYLVLIVIGVVIYSI